MRLVNSDQMSLLPLHLSEKTHHSAFQVLFWLSVVFLTNWADPSPMLLYHPSLPPATWHPLASTALSHSHPHLLIKSAEQVPRWHVNLPHHLTPSFAINAARLHTPSPSAQPLTPFHYGWSSQWGAITSKTPCFPAPCRCWEGADDRVRWGVREVRLGGGGRGVIKVNEPERRNLCIYSSLRKRRLKRSGNFPGHWPNPHGEEAGGWGGQESRHQQAGGGDTGIWTHAGAFELHLWPCVCVRRLCGREHVCGSDAFTSVCTPAAVNEFERSNASQRD